MIDARQPWIEPGIELFRRAVRTREAISGRPERHEEDTAIIDEAMRQVRADALEEAASALDEAAAALSPGNHLGTVLRHHAGCIRAAKDRER